MYKYRGSYKNILESYMKIDIQKNIFNILL